MNQLPRIDVGYSALVGAIVALAMLVLNGLALGLTTDWATALPPLLVVIAVGGVAWAFESSKELAGSVAGALLVLAQFVVSARRGEVVDAALVSAAVTYFVQLLLLWALPRVQPGRGEPPLRLP